MFTGFRQSRQCFLREEPLVDKFLWRLGIFQFNCVVQKHPIVSRRQILVMQPADNFHLCLHLHGERLRYRHGPVLFPLAVNREDAGIEIEITHPQLQALEQPQTAPEQQADREVIRVRQLFEYGVDLGSRKHHRNIERPFRSRYAAKLTKLSFETMTEQKQEGIERLVLS